MSCSKCFQRLFTEYVRCASCEELFHPSCLPREDVDVYLKKSQENRFWICRACSEDSDSVREELRVILANVDPNLTYGDGETVQALEVLDSLMKKVDERGCLLDKDRVTKKSDEEKEQDAAEVMAESKQEKEQEAEEVMAESKQEKEQEAEEVMAESKQEKEQDFADVMAESRQEKEQEAEEVMAESKQEKEQEAEEVMVESKLEHELITAGLMEDLIMDRLFDVD